MADNIQATPRNYLGGLLSDAYKWMQSPERTQQMQGFAGLLGTTGVPQTIERMAYGEPLTNIGRANVPLLKPETADAMMTVAPMVGPALRGAGRLAGSAVNEAMVYGRGPLASITPQPMRIIDLNKGIYKPDLTMNEMLKVRDIPTVDRVKQSIDLVGDKEFENMVIKQFKEYKPTSPEQEAMLVESVTLDILGRAKRSPYPQEEALRLAQQRAALPVEQGGLGLKPNNTAAERAAAMGFNTEGFHGTDAVNDFKKFNLTPNDETGIKGVSFALDPTETNAYWTGRWSHEGYGGRVIPVMVRGKAPEEYLGLFEQVIDNAKTYPKTNAGQNRMLKKALKDLDSVGIDYSRSIGGTEFSVLEPDRIRSRFAAFDPFRKTAATAAAMGVAAPDLLAQEQPVITQQQIDDEIAKYGLLGR